MKVICYRSSQRNLFKVGICFSIGPYVTDDDVNYIVDTIKASIME